MLWKEELTLGRAKKKRVAKRKKRMFTRNAIRVKMGKPVFFTLTHCNKKMSGISNKYNYKANMHKICFVGARFYNVKYQASIMTECNEHAIRLLTDWNNIEAKEYAKIAIGRIKTIEQFDKFIRADASERDVIQKFLEEFPWLLDPKMSKFEREITYINLLKRKFADESELPESNRRLDFLCTNSSGTIHIIELKRPSIKLRTKEIQQISEYVEFIETQFPQTQGHVKGFLISDNMTYEPGAEKVRKGLESVDIYVKSYSDLLAEARRYNDDLYRMYENISNKKNEKVGE